jgi:hypothetical protein
VVVFFAGLCVGMGGHFIPLIKLRLSRSHCRIGEDGEKMIGIFCLFPHEENAEKFQEAAFYPIILLCYYIDIDEFINSNLGVDTWII